MSPPTALLPSHLRFALLTDSYVKTAACGYGFWLAGSTATSHLVAMSDHSNFNSL